MNNNKYKQLYVSDDSESEPFTHDTRSKKNNNDNNKENEEEENEEEENEEEHIVHSINELLEEEYYDESEFDQEFHCKKKSNNNINNNDKNIYKLSYEKSVYEKYYVDPIILNNVDLNIYFDKNDIDLVKIYNHLYKTQCVLKITDKGLYSISKPQDAEWITNEIKSTFPQINQIIDGTAGIGGNVISFSRNFDTVIGVELNKVHYDILENNIKALRLDNVNIYNDNILDYYKEILNKEHVIFFMDPPWGGKRYKNFKNFILKIGKYCIHEFVEELYKEGYKYIVLKAPLNLNVNLLINNISYKNIKVVKHINMLLLLIY
jgi:16S rRNA G966 N2-methylase RsmD